jgi:peroxiredoxin
MTLVMPVPIGVPEVEVRDTPAVSSLVGKAAPAIHASRWLGCSPIHELRGKIVLLTFWATSCAPCLAEFPQTESFYRQARQSGSLVIGLAPWNEDPVRTQRAAAAKGATFPLALDSASVTAVGWGKTFDAYGTNSLPRHIVIDRQGLVRYQGSMLAEAIRVAGSLAGRGRK